MIFTAIKRFIERDRVVFVYRALTEGQGKFSEFAQMKLGGLLFVVRLETQRKMCVTRRFLRTACAFYLCAVVVQ